MTNTELTASSQPTRLELANANAFTLAASIALYVEHTAQAAQEAPQLLQNADGQYIATQSFEGHYDAMALLQVPAEA